MNTPTDDTTWLVTAYAPAFLDAANLPEHAAELRALRRPVDEVDAAPVLLRAWEAAEAASRMAGGKRRRAPRAGGDESWDAAFALGDAARRRAGSTGPVLCARSLAWLCSWSGRGPAPVLDPSTR